jgi:hypothetical protein
LGGSLALILQKHIPARDVKDLDIISPVSFGNLHETKFPYKGMVTSKKTYHIREIKTCLDFFHNPKAKYVTATFQGHIIKLSPVNEIVHAKENKIWSTVYKNKQENLKQIIKETFNEIKAQPGKTGTKVPSPYSKFVKQFPNKLNLKLGKYDLSGDEPGQKYSWEEASSKLSSTTKNNAESFFNKFNTQPQNIYIGIVYRGISDFDFYQNPPDSQIYIGTWPLYKAKSFYIEGNYKGTPIIIARKETRSPKAGQTYLVSPYAKLKFNHIKDLPTNEILAALKISNDDNIDEIKVQPINKLIKPTEKEHVTSKSYIDIDTSFINDYILYEGEINNYLEGLKNHWTEIRDVYYFDFILDGNYMFYFNENKQEINNILSLNDPLEIKDYARERAEIISTDIEDLDFYTEEIMKAIENIQEYVPQYMAAKKILENKFTIINSIDASTILTFKNNELQYSTIEKIYGFFNKNGEAVIYTT